MDKIIADLDDYRQRAKDVRDVLLGNLVRLGEVPSPTFRERRRAELLQQIFTECGLQNCSIDEMSNAMAVMPGTEGGENILVTAHSDTDFTEETDHNITLHTDRVVGPGVADNSLGLAVLASLPELVECLGETFRNNIILMSDSRSLGRGDLGGMRFFIENNRLPLKAAVCMEGAELGRLSFGCIGVLRAEVNCSVPDEYDWTKFGAASAIVSLNEVISRILEIPTPTRPRTNVMLERVEGGESLTTVATEAHLQFEVRSDSLETIESVSNQIDSIIAEIDSREGGDVTWKVIARRRPNSLAFTHPLVNNTKLILETLGVEPRMTPSTAELSVLLDHNMPAVTLGLTNVERLHQTDETVYIDPMFTGIAQLIGLLRAIDKGKCDGD